LADEWQAATKTLSSLPEMAMHPAYQRIIGMGPIAVPFILRRLAVEPGQWFWALRAITGADPVSEEQRGRAKQMATAWLSWARDQGIDW
jgi:hypothetical protein